MYIIGLLDVSVSDFSPLSTSPISSRSWRGCAIRRRGCEWDRVQTFETIAPYTIEEAYEVADAIRRDDMDALKDELGDLQLQVVYHARMAEERGAFTLDDVMASICAKMIRRHPHIFGDAADQPRLGGAQGGRARGPSRRKRAGRRRPRPPRPEARREDPAPRRPDRLRLARRRGPAAKIDEELAEIERAETDAGARRRARRPALRRGQLCPPPRCRPRNRPARGHGALRNALPQGGRNRRQASERHEYR